ncbi:MAG: ATP-binding protein, partial [Anaerolineales bacterium]|nr:ATP-binding protein [Anaerolineales bacterium]
QKRPSIELILNLLTERFETKLDLRGLLTDHGRLRQHQLLDSFYDGPRTNPTELDHFLRPPTHLVHYLLGEAALTAHSALDESLAVCATWAGQTEGVVTTAWLGESLYERLLALTKRDTAVANFAFYGGYGLGQLAAAQRIAAQRHEPLLVVDCALVRDWGEQLPILLRDARLHGAVLYLKHWDVLLEAHRPPQGVIEALWRYPGMVIFVGVQAWQARRVVHLKPLHEVHFPEPTYEVRRQIWAHYVGDTAVAETLNLHNLANHFKFSPGQIADAVATARHIAQWQDEPLCTQHLLTASRVHSNQNLADLATKIKLRHSWQDIILPPDTRQQLQELINQARQRPVVHHAWGFGAKLAGKGISALFTGEPGTGKTMSADIITGELGLDLYKVDLSSLVSKYIGETEKNLRRLYRSLYQQCRPLFGRGGRHFWQTG